MRTLRGSAFDSNQFFLPFEAAFLKNLVSRTKHRYASKPAFKACMTNEKKKRQEFNEYKVGVSIISTGTLPFRMEPKANFGVLEVLTPHIGARSALLLELLGYRTMRDLARTGYHLSALPSFGPKKIDKILAVIEGFGLTPPRRPAPVPRHWQRVFDQVGQ